MGLNIHSAQGQITPALALDFIHPHELPMLTNIKMARDTVLYDWPGWGEESPGEILDVAGEPMKVKMRNGSCRWPTSVPPFFPLCPLHRELFWLKSTFSSLHSPSSSLHLTHATYSYPALSHPALGIQQAFPAP